MRDPRGLQVDPLQHDRWLLCHREITGSLEKQKRGLASGLGWVGVNPSGHMMNGGSLMVIDGRLMVTLIVGV